jgi:hypothetical protein
MNERRLFLRGTLASACAAFAWCFGQNVGASAQNYGDPFGSMSSSSSSSSSTNSDSVPMASAGRRSVDASGQITYYDRHGRVVMVVRPWREHERFVTTYCYDTADSSAG